MKPKLAFLCGALRSGTSMMHLMLNAHPKIGNPGEFDFLFDLLAEKGKEPDIKEFIYYLSTDRIFLSKNLRLDHGAKDYRVLLNDLIDQLGTKDDVICLNLHRNFDIAYKYFPDAAYIHLVRDPRDVARSSIGMGWAGNVHYGVRHWVATEESWQRLLPMLDESGFTELCFEQLILEPENRLTDICQLLGLEFDTNMLEYDQHSRYSKPDKTLVNQWKRKLSKRDIELVELQASELMQISNYVTTAENPSAPNLLEKIRLKIENTIHRERFKIKKVGFWLYLALRITTKLRLHRLKRPYAAKSRVIIQRQLK